MARGPYGWLQDTIFLVSGTLVAAFRLRLRGYLSRGLHGAHETCVMAGRPPPLSEVADQGRVHAIDEMRLFGNRVVLWFFVLHYPILAVAAYYVIPLDLPLAVRTLILGLTSLVLSLAVADLLTRHRQPFDPMASLERSRLQSATGDGSIAAAKALK